MDAFALVEPELPLEPGVDHLDVVVGRFGLVQTDPTEGLIGPTGRQPNQG